MTLELKLWDNFSKRERSTAQPTGTPVATVDVYLKEETSLDKPVFLLEGHGLSARYAKFQDRYYFIRDIRRNITNQYEIECETDYGATYKTQIGNGNFFVERASHTYDVNINDNLVSQKQTYQKDFYSFAPLAGFGYILVDGGNYIVKVVGNDNAFSDNDYNPGVSTLLMSGKELEGMLNFLFTDSNFTDVISDATVKAFFNPFQYIVSVRWVPVSMTYYHSTHPNASEFHAVKCGWWSPMKTVQGLNVPVYGTEIEGYDISRVKFPTITKRYNDFRDYSSQWTRFKIYIPLVGNIEIDPIDIYSDDLYACYKLDLQSGIGLFTIEYGSTNAGKIIYQTNFDFGVDLQIGQLATNLQQVGSSISGAVTSMARGDLLGAAGNAVSGVTNAIQPTPSIKGQAASRVNYDILDTKIVRYTADTAEIPVYYSGRPLYQHKKISDIPGYIKCSEADIQISGLAGDREAVNSLLNGGFFYE